MQDAQAILSSVQAINAVRDSIASRHSLVGFDGFVDVINRPVATRQSSREYTPVETIADFGARISSAAGKSSNIELVPQVEKMGGNGPLMSMALCGMGAQVTCLGLLGYPDILPVFKPLLMACKSTVSVGNPGHTDAIEFSDGKIMLGKLNTLVDMSWERLVEVMGENRLRDTILGNDLVACTNWTMLTEMNGILERLIAMIPPGSPVKFFFDLADPEKRLAEDLRQVLGLIRSLGAKAKCVLGLNLREAEQVGHLLGLSDSVEETESGVEAAAVSICRKLELWGVVVHGIKFAGACLGDEHAGVAGPYCPAPKLSTGAGDHFNGGFCAGLLGGLSVREALYLGVGTSGCYVRSGNSPTIPDVTRLLTAWAREELQD